uniref:Uncharacterized protein n=1 Tax=Nonomuraea gerenzanensis TaxID=93944 RepID=A0A1M4ED62_9ACTN|nr:hypothetical protein BN4615_P6266 [Nonomuraea gerenzanensis]
MDGEDRVDVILYRAPQRQSCGQQFFGAMASITHAAIVLTLLSRPFGGAETWRFIAALFLDAVHVKSTL